MENIRTLAALLALPFVCTWRFLLSCCREEERQKTWRRVIFDAIFRWLVHTHPLHRLGYYMGQTQDIYVAWAKRNTITVHTESIRENAKIHWVLNEQSDGKIPQRVILYLHGGGFVLPVSEDAVSFWHHIQKELKNKHGLDVGVAILDYSLVPEAHFPVPLLQTIAAVRHLLSRGLKMENILVTGDSAGGNLTLQLLSHILHPLAGLPALEWPPSSKFGGAYLMSPWVTLLPTQSDKKSPSKNSYVENEMWDIVSPSKLGDFGSLVLSGIKSADHLPYIDSRYTPSGWYDRLYTAVNTVLITAGGRECLRDDIVKFGKELNSGVGTFFEVKLVVDKYGVHNDPFFDFFAGEKGVSELTPMIILWCCSVFSS